MFGYQFKMFTEFQLKYSGKLLGVLYLGET